MRSVLAILRQVLALFVDDGSLACALVIWCAGAGFALPRLIPFSAWNAPILLLGCIAILLANIALAARSHRGKKARKPGPA